MTRLHLIPVIMVITWLAGCSGESKPEPAVEKKQPSAAVASPLTQVQQSLAIHETVDRAARQTDTKSGRRAQSQIDKINAKRNADMAEVW